LRKFEKYNKRYYVSGKKMSRTNQDKPTTTTIKKNPEMERPEIGI
jgi:hypothetical protein